MTKYVFLQSLALTLSAFIAYAGFFFFFLYNNPCTLLFDSGHYHAGALALLKQGAYVSADGMPLLYRLPGYPFFLAGLYWLSNYWLQGALFLQIIFAATIPVLIWQVILQLTGRQALATLTAWLSVCAPAYMIFAGLVMSEMLSAWLFLVLLLLFLRAFERPDKLRFFIGSGVVLGCMSLVRPVGHLLIPFVVLYLMVFYKCLIPIIIFVASWVIVVAPWLLRNFLLTGHLFFHTLPGSHFINHVAVRLVATGEQISYKDAQIREYDHLRLLEEGYRESLGRNLSQIELCKLYEHETTAMIKRYPIQFVQLAAINCFKTMFSLYSSELLVIDSGGELPSYDRTGLLVAVKRFFFPTVHNKLIVGVIYFEILLLLLSIIGASLAIVRFWRLLLHPRVVLVVGLLGFFIGISLGCGYARLRIAVEPFYLLAAAYAIHELYFWYQRSLSGRLLSK